MNTLEICFKMLKTNKAGVICGQIVDLDMCRVIVGFYQSLQTSEERAEYAEIVNPQELFLVARKLEEPKKVTRIGEARNFVANDLPEATMSSDEYCFRTYGINSHEVMRMKSGFFQEKDLESDLRNGMKYISAFLPSPNPRTERINQRLRDYDEEMEFQKRSELVRERYSEYYGLYF